MMSEGNRGHQAPLYTIAGILTVLKWQRRGLTGARAAATVMIEHRNPKLAGTVTAAKPRKKPRRYRAVQAQPFPDSRNTTETCTRTPFVQVLSLDCQDPNHFRILGPKAIQTTVPGSVMNLEITPGEATEVFSSLVSATLTSPFPRQCFRHDSPFLLIILPVHTHFHGMRPEA